MHMYIRRMHAIPIILARMEVGSSKVDIGSSGVEVGSSRVEVGNLQWKSLLGHGSHCPPESCSNCREHRNGFAGEGEGGCGCDGVALYCHTAEILRSDKREGEGSEGVSGDGGVEGGEGCRWP